MSSTAVCPGLLFATLVVQLAQANGAAIVNNVARRRGGGCDPDDGESCSSVPASTKTVIMTKTVPMSLSSATANNPSSSTTPLPSSSSSPTASSPATSPSPTDARLDNNLVKGPSISTGGIVGAALGSLIILGLALMLLTKCINRSRKANKRPKGFVQTGSFPPSRPHTPMTEMSQTQFSHPVISSDIVAQATSGPYPHSSAYYSTSSSSKTPTFASSTPLLPTAGASVAHSVTNSSARRTSLSYTDISSDAGHPLPSPYDTATLSSWHASQASSAHGGAGVSSSLAAAAVAAIAASPNASPLHRSMAAFQKALEDESNKANSAAANVHDPPPQYDP